MRVTAFNCGIISDWGVGMSEHMRGSRVVTVFFAVCDISRRERHFEIQKRDF